MQRCTSRDHRLRRHHVTILAVGVAGVRHIDARFSTLATRLQGLETAVGELRERMARLEGAMEGFMAGFRRGAQGADGHGAD
ncbi:MAG: hypothetical protein OXF93_11765 [Acidobacteria bacterium]|nr:hypothetical protein [Acidobacteriota bacterium]